MKFDLRFIFTLLVVLAIAAAASPAVAGDTDADQLEARGRRDKCGQLCSNSSDCSGKCGYCDKHGLCKRKK